MSADDLHVRAAIATAASYCRQRSSDGNIQIIFLLEAIRTMGAEIMGKEEFARWEHWVVPTHVAVQRALDGGEPG